MRLILLLALAACQTEPDTGPPGEDFLGEVDLSITEPTRDQSVESPVAVRFAAGADIAVVAAEIDGEPVDTITPQDGEGALSLDLDGGRRRLTLRGLSADGEELGLAEVVFRVATPHVPWVGLHSPPDGGLISNPITVVATGDDDLERLEVLADGVSIGDIDDADMLRWTFPEAVETPHQITVQGWKDGQVVASVDAAVTVLPKSSPPASAFADAYLTLADAYPMDGTNGYYWPDDTDWLGVTRDVWYQDTLVAPADPEGRCYCVGYSWEVYMAAWEQADALEGGDGTLIGMTLDDLHEFRVDWYVRDLWGDGVGVALTGWGLGERVTDWEDLQPGDLLQFWRYSGSGHNAIFLDHVRDEQGRIRGIEYLSCVGSTDGIGVTHEYFGDGGSEIDPAFFYAARPFDPVRP